MARPTGAQKNIDVELLKRLARIGATQFEISQTLGLSSATLERRLQRKEIREALDSARADLHTSLRTKQVQLALAGNVTMLIWLGKQYLGQRDQVDMMHQGSGPGGEIEVDVNPGEWLRSRLAQLAERKRAIQPPEEPETGAR